MATKREFLSKDDDTVIKTEIDDQEVWLNMYSGGDSFYLSSNTYNLKYDATPAQIEKVWREENRKWEKLAEVIRRCSEGADAIFSKAYDDAVARQETKDAD